MATEPAVDPRRSRNNKALIAGALTGAAWSGHAPDPRAMFRAAALLGEDAGLRPEWVAQLHRLADDAPPLGKGSPEPVP
jgi:hypothetical protein